MAFSRLMLTTSGRVLFAKAQQGKPLKFTRVAIGDGNLGSGSLVNRTVLISEKRSLLIDVVQLTDDATTATVVAQLSNADLATGFYFRELGIYAQDPDTHTETLYVYDNAGTDGEYIPAASSGVIVSEYLKLMLQVSGASSITFNPSGNPLYLTRDEVGVPGGVAGLGADGKVFAEQLPAMDYEPGGTAAAAVAAHNAAANAHSELLAKKVDKGENGKIPPTQLPPMMAVWKLLQSYTTAGAFTWTAPDLFGGKPYKIGVFLKGAGGSGIAINDTVSTSTKQSRCIGGSAGRTLSFILTVTPNQTYTGVVGVGGARVSAAVGTVRGNAGGASSFAERSVSGGSGGEGYGATTTNFVTGSQVPIFPESFDEGVFISSGVKPFGGAVFPTVSPAYYPFWYMYPNECHNPFTDEKEMGAGGSISTAYYDAKIINNWIILGGKYADGKGGGNPSVIHKGNSQGQDANSAGCGGGPAVTINISSTSYTATSGKGADGAVYIYIPEVSV